MSLRGGLDLDGRIVIKVQLGNDVRKLLIHNDDVTYDELVLMMQRIYKGTIKQDDELIIKYKDEDGDLITIFDSTDVSFAIQTCNRQLKLVLYVNGLERSFDDAEVGTIRKGLQNVRNLVNTLLDQIDAKDPARGRLEVNKQSEDAGATDEQAPAVPTPAPSQPAVDSKEFDPLDSSSAQPESIAGGDKASQFGEVAKSFDQVSISDRQSANPSPTPSNIQSSFGTAFGVSDAQQPSASMSSGYQTSGQPMSTAQGMTSGQPMSTAQGMTTMPGSQPSSAAGYYAQQQYGNTAQPSGNLAPLGTPASSAAPTGMPPTSTQQTQQQFNYNQWNQQTQQHQQPQQTQQQHQQPQQTQQQMPGAPSSYGGYGMQPGQQLAQQTQQQPPQQPPQQPQQQSTYGQMPASPYQGLPSGANPYSKPGAIRGSYPKASGAYPQLAPTGQRPPFPPQQ